VATLSFFIGAVVALQSGYTFSEVGSGYELIGSAVGLSMARMLGPLMAALLLAGRVGSAITAELASMTVYHEVDALRTMNVPPERILVLPRLIAVALMMPILTVGSIVAGWLGGMIAANYVDFISLDPAIYWRTLTEYVYFRTVFDGLIKAEIFGICVVLISCNQGLSTKGGPREIGYSVTKAVVASMIVVLFLDFFITRLLLAQ
jgi:phospholipid/cholesterol/gamma-HCH transport system permease protein